MAICGACSSICPPWPVTVHVHNSVPLGRGDGGARIPLCACLGLTRDCKGRRLPCHRQAAHTIAVRTAVLVAVLTAVLTSILTAVFTAVQQCKGSQGKRLSTQQRATPCLPARISTRFILRFCLLACLHVAASGCTCLHIYTLQPLLTRWCVTLLTNSQFLPTFAGLGCTLLRCNVLALSDMSFMSALVWP